MKKFFSLFAAILFAGSMMAEPIVINASDVTTIASGATSGLDVTLQGINIVWQGAYYNTDGSDGGSASVDFRVYANKSMTLTAESNISKVEIAGYCKAGLTVTANAGTITTGASYASETTKRTLEDPLIVVDEIGATSVTLTCTKQVRAYTLRITLDGDVPPVVADIYTVAGNDAAIFGEAWNPALAANDMTLANGIYKWEKAELDLTAGDIEFKVAKNHSWDVAYPAQNYVLNIAEDGEYTITITFDPTTETVAAEAVKKVIPQYEVAEAIAAGLTDNDEIFVRGIITKMEFKGKNFAKYGSVNIYVADATGAEGAFEFYNCYSLNADTFRTSDPAYDAESTAWVELEEVADENGNAIHVGDTVIAFGKYKLYSGTHELNTGCYLVEVKHPEDAPVEHTYTVAGGSDVLFGTTWAPANEANDMALVEGLYTWEKSELTLAAGNIEFKVCEDHAWTTAYPAQNYQLNIPEAGIYTVTITFNAETKEVAAVATKTGEAVVVPTVAMHGNFLGSWADTENFAIAQDNASASLTLTLAEGNYEFGMRIGGSGNWTANGANLTREANTTNLAEGSGNMHIAADVAGDYVFTYTYETQVLEVVYPEAPVVPDTIAIVITSGVVYEDYVADAGWWQFIANNDEYSITISNLSTTQAAGTYTIDDLDADYSYITVKATDTDIAFVEGSFLLTEGEDGSRTIEGTVLGDDDNIYYIKLVFTIPTAQTTVNVEIPEWGVYNGAEYYGFASYLFAGEAADGTYVQIVIPGSNPVGQFTYDDVYAGGTGIEVAGDFQSIYSMNITINVSDAGRAIITADILCFDYTLYHVTTIVGEGVDNIDAAVKAIKSIVNGQVVIEKAGKTYNMNGAVIR